MGKIRYSGGNDGGGSFTPYPEGTYDFEITEVEVVPAKSSDKSDQLKLKTVILGGEKDGKQFTRWVSLSEKSAWVVERLLEATGCPRQQAGEDKNGKPVFEFDENDLIGLRYTADLKIREWNGKAQNQSDNDRPYEEPAPVGKKASAPARASAPAAKAPAKAAPQEEPQEEEEPDPVPTPAPASRFRRPSA